MARRPFDPAAQGLRKTEYRQGDVLDRAAVDALVAEADVVVHLAFIIMGGHEETRQRQPGGLAHRLRGRRRLAARPAARLHLVGRRLRLPRGQPAAAHRGRPRPRQRPSLLLGPEGRAGGDAAVGGRRLAARHVRAAALHRRRPRRAGHAGGDPVAGPPLTGHRAAGPGHALPARAPRRRGERPRRRRPRRGRAGRLQPRRPGRADRRRPRARARLAARPGSARHDPARGGGHRAAAGAGQGRVAERLQHPGADELREGAQGARAGSRATTRRRRCGRPWRPPASAAWSSGTRTGTRSGRDPRRSAPSPRRRRSCRSRRRWPACRLRARPGRR